MPDNKFLCLILFLVLFIACTERNTIVDPDDSNNGFTEIEGSLSGTLPFQDSPYLVINDLQIDVSDSLIVEPDVQIYFTDSSHFLIRGRISAIGNKENFIHFTANVNFWNGIIIQNSYKNSIFRFCTIEKVASSSGDSSQFSAVEINNSTAIIKNCIIRDNQSENGAGITINQSEVEITNNLFRNNQVIAFGGAIITYQSYCYLINNTFFENYSVNVGAAIAIFEPVNNIIQNNIFYKNNSQQGYSQIFTQIQYSANYHLSYNFISMDTPDPQFISDDNLRLQYNSPCLDNGNPDTQYNDPDGSRNDQGAYGGPFGDW